ncbi:MAG: DUF5317 family protein [Aldersonia sp.]|nr:DUF5317 family protein [Aldersonia sp.]
MILLAAFVLVALTVPITGGNLTAVADIKLRWMPALFATLAAQILVTTVAPDAFPVDVMAALHLATYVPAVAFVLVNRDVRGLWLVGLGGGLNLAAIATNDGVMPSLPSAAAAAGQTAAGHFMNSAPTTDAPLWFFGDVFAWPQPLPLANVFSVGDLLLVIGAGVVLHIACRPKPEPVGSWSTALPST